MKLPGPDHPITITPAAQRWRARYEGHVIADTDDALILQEANYPPVVYFPRDDVSMEYMGRTDHHTHCPYKGDASYYTLRMDSRIEDNAVWTYEEPYPAMSAIAGRLAFYPDKVEIYAVDDAAVNPHHTDEPSVDEVVKHTDSGAGRAQREPWPPNVTQPGGDEGGVR
jgi:uncharacterized protein (DUF427 family)